MCTSLPFSPALCGASWVIKRLLDVKHRKSVIVEAQTAYGVIRIRTPYYGFEYETGAFDSVWSIAGRQRVITGYEEVKEELLGLYLKEINIP